MAAAFLWRQRRALWHRYLTGTAQQACNGACNGACNRACNKACNRHAACSMQQACNRRNWRAIGTQQACNRHITATQQLRTCLTTGMQQHRWRPCKMRVYRHLHTHVHGHVYRDMCRHACSSMYGHVHKHDVQYVSKSYYMAYVSGFINVFGRWRSHRSAVYRRAYRHAYRVAVDLSSDPLAAESKQHLPSFLYPTFCLISVSLIVLDLCILVTP